MTRTGIADGIRGTRKKCKVRIVSGSVPLSPVDPRAFEPEQLKAGWLFIDQLSFP